MASKRTTIGPCPSVRMAVRAPPSVIPSAARDLPSSDSMGTGADSSSLRSSE